MCGPLSLSSHSPLHHSSAYNLEAGWERHVVDSAKASVLPTQRVTMFSMATSASAYALSQCSSHASAGLTPREAEARAASSHATYSLVFLAFTEVKYVFFYIGGE